MPTRRMRGHIEPASYAPEACWPCRIRWLVQCFAMASSSSPREDSERTAFSVAVEGTRGPRERDRFTNIAVADYALPNGTLIEGFRITKAIGQGGFGIVYLAWESALDRNVAIKEYMPSLLAVREQSSFSVSVRSEECRETFAAGLKSFVNEARLLGRFNHHALVKVFQFWEANRTAYMAMPYYEGRTLKAVLKAPPEPFTETQLRAWVHPLLDALDVIHRERCYHRDISPDNILLTDSGPVLLDFGAARRVISDMTQSLTAVLKHGYAPIEQYGGAMMQGPWTDLYALAGVMHHAITGQPPSPSVERIINDTLQPLATTHAGRYGDSFLRAIDAALSVRPEARPQNVAQFRALLDAGLTPASHSVLPTSQFQHSVDTNEGVVAVASDRNGSQTKASPFPTAPARLAREGTPAWRTGKAVFALAAAAVLLAGGAVVWMTTRDKFAPSVDRMPTARETPAPTATARDAAPTPAAGPAPAAAPASASIPSPGETPAPTPAEPPETPQLPTAAESPKEPPKVKEAPAVADRSRPTANPPAPTGQRARPIASSRVVTESKRATLADQPPPSSYNERVRPPRCGAIVQKSSLESLSPEEVAFLKRECR